MEFIDSFEIVVERKVEVIETYRIKIPIKKLEESQVKMILEEDNLSMSQLESMGIDYEEGAYNKEVVEIKEEKILVEVMERDKEKSYQYYLAPLEGKKRVEIQKLYKKKEKELVQKRKGLIGEIEIKVNAIGSAYKYMTGSMKGISVFDVYENEMNKVIAEAEGLDKKEVDYKKYNMEEYMENYLQDCCRAPDVKIHGEAYEEKTYSLMEWVNGLRGIKVECEDTDDKYGDDDNYIKIEVSYKSKK